MKVVFLQDVAGSGHQGEIKDVADGYAVNYLIPRKLAMAASEHTIRQLEAHTRAEEKRKAQMQADLAKQADELNGKLLTLSAKVGSKGRLYGSITSADIAAELKRSFGVGLDKRKIELAEPLHELGTFKVGVKLSREHVPELIVKVVPQGEG